MKKQLLTATIATSLLFSQAPVHAAEAENDNNGEIKEEVFTYGHDLSPEQKKETEQLLDVGRNVKQIDVDVDDVRSFTNTTYQGIYSSASIKPKSFGSGVDVEIVNPENITDVSKAQYMNAAISAGIKNADIKIGAVVNTLGYGALTGIYQAYKEEGNDLNQEDINNASNELETLSNISKNHEDDPNYSDGAMNNAVADMKGQAAKEEKKQEDVSDDTIRSIVDDVLKDKQLDNVINGDEKTQITNIIINTAQSDAVKNDPDSFIDQTNHLKSKVSDAIEKGKHIDKEEASKEAEGFLSKTWNWIKGLFS